jgi:hypothetical protein
LTCVTSDGGIEAVEQFVRQCADRIEGTPYLTAGMARVFLEELAYAKHGPRTVSTVAASRFLIWPDGMSLPDRHAAIAALLTESGIVTVAREEFRFVSPDARDYLRACHIVRRYPKGPGRWLSRAAKYLQPRSQWTDEDEGLARFLVVLWWPNARPAVERQLGKLLDEQHRDPNIVLVADLCRRGWLPGSDLPHRTTEILRAEVGTAKRSEKAWQAMVAALRSLDPATAVHELEQVVRSPRPNMTVTRQFTAVTELTKHDAALGAANLAHLADHLWGEPDDQVAVAVRIAAVDHDLGVRTLTRLARDPDLGESRVDAALAVDEPALWAELAQDPVLADEGRLRVFTRLLERDQDAALAVVPSFAATAHADRTRLAIAGLVTHAAPDLAWQLAHDLAWTTDRRVDDRVRLDGVLLLGKLDPTQSVTLLERFSAWPARSDEVRLRAAVAVVEQGGPPTALDNLAHDKGVRTSRRADAAKKLGELDRTLGARAYIAIADTCSPTDHARIDHLRAAFVLAPGPATTALTAVAMDKRYPDRIRVDAVDTARSALSTSRRIELYSAIVLTAAKDATALAIARKVKTMDLDEGQQLMAKVTQRNMPMQLRLEAAEEAGRHGQHALLDFAKRARPAPVRFAAAKALAGIDPRLSDRVFAELATTRRIGDVRVNAALELPQAKKLRCLADIAADRREQENVQFAAGLAIMEHDHRMGRQVLTTLANSGVSRSMRNRITGLLG